VFRIKKELDIEQATVQRDVEAEYKVSVLDVLGTFTIKMCRYTVFRELFSDRICSCTGTLHKYCYFPR
jgi:hypothetical protein